MFQRGYIQGVIVMISPSYLRWARRGVSRPSGRTTRSRTPSPSVGSARVAGCAGYSYTWSPRGSPLGSSRSSALQVTSNRRRKIYLWNSQRKNSTSLHPTSTSESKWEKGSDAITNSLKKNSDFISFYGSELDLLFQWKNFLSKCWFVGKDKTKWLKLSEKEVTSYLPEIAQCACLCRYLTSSTFP